jgi:hypothetical protein
MMAKARKIPRPFLAATITAIAFAATQGLPIYRAWAGGECVRWMTTD